MARPWRDVISEWYWRRAVEERADKSSAQGPTTGTKILAVVKDRYESPTAFLRYIGEKLHQYHMIAKDDYYKLEKRVKALKELSSLANEYFTRFKVDMQVAQKRNEENHPSKHTGRHQSGKPMDESVDRNVLTLARRSLRKAAYLKQLREFYSKHGAGYQYRVPQALLEYVKHPQKKTDALVGLSGAVRMEQLDFAHRGDYEVDDENSISCGAAFTQWTKDPRRGNTPFFLWLENHAVCLEDDKSKFETHAVEYIRADHRDPATSLSMLKLVVIDMPLKAIDLTKKTMTLAVCSTKGYKAERRKDPRGDKGWGTDVAAFVWTEAGELFIANHMAQQFHHSSFVSGNTVRCAGMIVIENGIVTAISNNSGHYKPRKEIGRAHV